MSETEERTILLIWNPTNGLPHEVSLGSDRTKLGEVVFNRWSTGSTKFIKPGARCFLMRVSAEPKGIVGSGYIVTPPEHDPSTANTHYSGIAFTMMLDTDQESEVLVPLEKLQGDKKLKATNWLSAGSGIRIKAESIDALEEEWARLLRKHKLEEVEGKLEDWIARGEERNNENDWEDLDHDWDEKEPHEDREEDETDESDEFLEEDDDDDEEEEDESGGVTLADIREQVQLGVEDALNQLDLQEIVHNSIEEVVESATKGGLMSKVEIAVRLRIIEKRLKNIEKRLA